MQSYHLEAAESRSKVPVGDSAEGCQSPILTLGMCEGWMPEKREVRGTSEESRLAECSGGWLIGSLSRIALRPSFLRI